MIPVGLQPVCHIRHQATFWTLVGSVNRTLKRAKFDREAQEFRGRAVALAVDDLDTTDLLSIAMDYVRLV